MNLHYIPKSYKTKTVNCALKLLGVPIRWKGRMEYYQNGDWKSVYDKKKDTECRKIFVFWKSSLRRK